MTNEIDEKFFLIRSLMQELQSLRSMVGKGTPATGKVLMVKKLRKLSFRSMKIRFQVLCLFFAVLFGIWSPIVNKQSSDGSNSQQKSVSSSSSSSSSAKSHDGSTTSRNTGGASSKSLLDEQDLIKQEPTYNNYLPHNYKSRVLLSYDEHDQHYHGPYLPSNSKQQKSTFTYSNSVEKFTNKRFKTNSQTEENSDEKCSEFFFSSSFFLFSRFAFLFLFRFFSSTFISVFKTPIDHWIITIDYSFERFDNIETSSSTIESHVELSNQWKSCCYWSTSR